MAAEYDFCNSKRGVESDHVRSKLFKQWNVFFFYDSELNVKHAYFLHCPINQQNYANDVIFCLNHDKNVQT